MQIIAELKRRKVVQIGAAYLVPAWVLAQVALLLQDRFATPDWVIRIFLLMLAAGFPLTLFLAWSFRLTPFGIQREREEVVALAGILPAPLAALAAASSEPSIAVLPLVNMSEDRANEYFADGLSEELINLLTRVPSLRVIARTSSFAFKGKDVKIADVAHELKVGHVLEGSVRKSANRLRVTAQLIRASDSSHLWSETYDRTLDDIFAVQDEIAGKVVAALKLQFLGDCSQPNRETNPKAYELYLQARQLNRLHTETGYRQGLEVMHRALALDPDYAPGWVGLALIYFNLSGRGMTPIKEGRAKAIEAIDKALDLDPCSAEGHMLRGVICDAWEWDFAAGERHLRRAMELDPGNLETLRAAARRVAAAGNIAEAIRMEEARMARDPGNPTVYQSLGYIYYIAGRYEEAERLYRQYTALKPGAINSGFMIGRMLLAQDRFDAALAAFETEPAEFFRITGRALAQQALGNTAAADAALHMLIEKFANEAAYLIASVYAHRGANDEAFAWLDRAFETRDVGLAEMKPDPLLRGLHADPRWHRFLARIRLDSVFQPISTDAVFSSERAG